MFVEVKKKRKTIIIKFIEFTKHSTTEYIVATKTSNRGPIIITNQHMFANSSQLGS